MIAGWIGWAAREVKKGEGGGWSWFTNATNTPHKKLHIITGFSEDDKVFLKLIYLYLILRAGGKISHPREAEFVA